MKKILCPTDFSATARNGVDYAARLAQATGAGLVLLNVQSVSDAVPVRDDSSDTFPVAKKSLQDQSDEVQEKFGISCQAELQPSSASLSRTIAKHAAGYDLVVMGTNGPDDIYQFLMGSNAYNASVKSEVPVLLVPENCSYRKIKNVVYAFDYLRERKLPLAQLKPLLRTLKAGLSVLQVMEEAYSQEAEDELKELQFISQTLYAEDIQLKFDTIRSYEIAESIHGYVVRTRPDLLALCAVHRNLLERFFHNSLIKDLTAASRYPVYIFHQ